jgi:hypothetical protein
MSEPTIEPWISGIVYTALAILLISGALTGIRAGKFVLGRRLGFSPYIVSREQKPILFWMVAAILAGLGVILLFDLSLLKR